MLVRWLGHWSLDLSILYSRAGPNGFDVEMSSNIIARVETDVFNIYDPVELFVLDGIPTADPPWQKPDDYVALDDMPTNISTIWE